MKAKFLFSSALFALYLAVPMVQAASLTFTIEQIKSNQGTVNLQLFQGEANFKAEKHYTQSMNPAKAGSMTFSFHDLAPGDYAIRYFHDENGDGELQTNLFGLPTEGYGFSNNARANFGPPAFKDMKITVGDADLADKSIIQY